MTTDTIKVEEQVRDLLCTGDTDTWDWGGGSNPWSWGGAVDWLHFKRNGTGAVSASICLAHLISDSL